MMKMDSALGVATKGAGKECINDFNFQRKIDLRKCPIDSSSISTDYAYIYIYIYMHARSMERVDSSLW